MKRTTIGDRLRQAREAMGYKSGDLARKSGLQNTVIWKLEHGKSKSAGPGIIEKLANALQVRPAWLMFGDPPMKEGAGLQRCLDFFDENTWRPETIAVARFENLQGETRHQSEWVERLNEIEAALDTVIKKEDQNSAVFEVPKIKKKRGGTK